MKINILALDGVFDTGLATVQDVFGTANELAGLLGLAVPPFEVALIGMRRKVRTAQGLGVPVLPAGQAGTPDWTVIPALGEKMPDGLQLALQRRDVADATAALREQSARGVRIAAACIGTFEPDRRIALAEQVRQPPRGGRALAIAIRRSWKYDSGMRRASVRLLVPAALAASSSENPSARRPRAQRFRCAEHTIGVSRHGRC
jgi:hypothetical protein